jgi:hypothetical protein
VGYVEGRRARRTIDELMHRCIDPKTSTIEALAAMCPEEDHSLKYVKETYTYVTSPMNSVQQGAIEHTRMQ